MGLSIGHSPAVLGALAPSSRVRATTLHESPARSRHRLPNESESEAFTPLRSERTETPRIGAGSGSASSPHNALTAISRTVDGVNRTRPSLEELTARNQARAAQARAQFKAQLQTRQETQKPVRIQPQHSTPQIAAPQPKNETPPPFASSDSNKVELRLPRPSVRAKTFLSASSHSPGDVPQRPQHTPPLGSSSGPPIQINAQSFPFGNKEAGPVRINLTA